MFINIESFTKEFLRSRAVEKKSNNKCMNAILINFSDVVLNAFCYVWRHLKYFKFERLMASSEIDDPLCIGRVVLRN